MKSPESLVCVRLTVSPSAICDLCTFLSADIFLELTVPGVDGFAKLQNEPGAAELQPWPRCHDCWGESSSRQRTAWPHQPSFKTLSV